MWRVFVPAAFHLCTSRPAACQSPLRPSFTPTLTRYYHLYSTRLRYLASLMDVCVHMCIPDMTVAQAATIYSSVDAFWLGTPTPR